MWISPATSLDHEASHAVLFDNYSTGKMSEQEKKEYISRRQKNSDSQYDTKEERFIITNREQKTARKHGEISDMQVTRADHKIKQVTGSVSEKNPDEIEKIIWTNNSLL